MEQLHTLMSFPITINIHVFVLKSVYWLYLPINSRLNHPVGATQLHQHRRGSLCVLPTKYSYTREKRRCDHDGHYILVADRVLAKATDQLQQVLHRPVTDTITKVDLPSPVNIIGGSVKV